MVGLQLQCKILVLHLGKCILHSKTIQRLASPHASLLRELLNKKTGVLFASLVELTGSKTTTLLKDAVYLGIFNIELGRIIQLFL